MSMKFDLSAYIICGRENTMGRSLSSVIEDAVKAGFTFVQIRSKEESAREMIEDCREAAAVIRELGKENDVALVVNDRLDVILAAREEGIKVDGIHVGQTDIPVSVCRKYLGKDAVIGLSAPIDNLIGYVRNCDIKDIDYFGAGPVHETSTKQDCKTDTEGKQITAPLEELKELVRVSPLPVVAGGGVKKEDIKSLKESGMDGFFVISAVAGAEDPYKAAKELTEEWYSN